MDGPHERPAPVAFDRYAFDPRERRLLCDGTPVVLHGKAFDLLSILLARRGAAASREELYQQLWPNGAVEDGNLTQTVYLLRRTLDPAGDGRGFVETLPRFGYRFAMPVREGGQPESRRAHTSLRVRFGAATAAALALVMTAGPAVQPSTIPLNPPASAAYSVGLYHLNLRTPGNLRHSVTYFARTALEAPRSALGFAGLASAYGLEAEFERDGSPAFTKYVGLAKRYRDRALAIDRASGDAHAVAAWLAYRFDNDPALAEREFRRALTIEPRNAGAHHWHAVLLFSQGSLDAALAEWELAHQLSPTSEVISRWLGRAYYYRRRPDDAIRVLSETLTIEPADAPARLGLASAQEQRGNLREALRTLHEVRRRLPDENAYAIPDEARVRLLLNGGAVDPHTVAQIDRLVAAKRVDAVESALFYLSLGLRDRAIAVLQRSRPFSPIAAVMAKYDPRFDAVRTDRRFQHVFDRPGTPAGI